MSATVQAKGVAAAFGDRTLFSGLDLVVAPGDVVGLVGPNGAGKSTLLHILGGERRPDAGTVSVSPAHAQLGHLAQEIERRPGETVREHLERRTGVAQAQLAMDAAAEALATEVPGSDDVYGEALEAWLALGGADLESRLGTVTDELGLGDRPRPPDDGALRAGRRPASASQRCCSRASTSTCSTSRRTTSTRRAWTCWRSSSSARRRRSSWSATTASSSRGPSRASSRSTAACSACATYGGSYDAYLEERSIARRRAREAYDDYAARLGGLESRARMQRAWMEKGVKNARRKVKDNDKIGRKFRSEATEKQAAKARQTEKMISRLEVVEEPRKEWQLQMSIATAARSGAVVAVARGAVVERGGFRLGPVDLQIAWKDRVAVTGPNGAGKSTLLALLLGRLAPSSGAVDLGSGVLVGEVDQARALFEGDEPLGDAFARQVPDWQTAEVRTLLAKFGLVAHHITRPASSQSPGERTRAALALLQARGVNLLGARRADEPPRPAGDRAARAGDGLLRRARSCWSRTTAGCSRRCG